MHKSDSGNDERESVVLGNGVVATTNSVDQLEQTFDAVRRMKAESFGKRRRERRQVEAIAKLLNKGDMFIDVGGFVGNFTAHMVAAKKCRAVLFEPVSGHCEFCRRRFAGNNAVTVEQLGLSDRSEEIDIFRGHRNLAWNTMIPEVTNRRNRLLPSEKTRCVTFDDYRAENKVGRVDCVKIDVEGYEWRVLRGMRQTIAECLPHIECELHYGMEHPNWQQQNEEFDYLHELGYRGFDIRSALNGQGKRHHLHVLLHRPLRRFRKRIS